MVSLLDLDPETYRPSPLHGPDRTFRETNCYVDLWIELLHACGIDPASCLSFAFRVDFEGDQWTFFKPPPGDLEDLYGIDVHEMQIYRPVADHALEQLRTGRTLVLEVDSFFLPDTCGAAYRQAHVKSSIAIEAIDTTGERLRYFHGAGFHELTGEDYRGVFRLGCAFSAGALPPYMEVVDFHAGRRLSGEHLRCAARRALGRHLEHRPKRNPWIAFGERLRDDLTFLMASAPNDYHAYAFATVRQCGAAFESARSFIEWSASPECPHGRTAADALGRQVAGAKAIVFRLARQRPFDPAPLISQLAEDWQIALDAAVCLARINDSAQS